VRFGGGGCGWQPLGSDQRIKPTRGQRALAIEHKPKYYHGEARQGEWKDGQNILHQRSFPIARLASNTQTCVTRAG
jgi:hypothetical protein